MSREAAITFIRAIGSDRKLQEELAGAMAESGEVPMAAVVSLAASWGLSVTPEDWQAVHGAATTARLSDAELEGVAGGVRGISGESDPAWSYSGDSSFVLPDGTRLLMTAGGFAVR
jgi:predicted ribosomally synthesized peptide with nif11-like leader